MCFQEYLGYSSTSTEQRKIIFSQKYHKMFGYDDNRGKELGFNKDIQWVISATVCKVSLFTAETIEKA